MASEIDELRSGESRMWACNVCGRQCRHDLMAWLPNPQGGELSLCRGCSSVGTMEGSMASEIDEAAAVEHCRWIIANPGAFAGKDYAAHNAARAALAWKARAEERLNQAALDWRGINTPCGDCGGRGSKAYPNSAGWAGGIGGQAMTSGVCDKCWGSGDAEKTWANLRHVSAHIEQATRELDVALARAEQLAASEAERDAAIARAEAAEAERDILRRQLAQAVKAR